MERDYRIKTEIASVSILNSLLATEPKQTESNSWKYEKQPLIPDESFANGPLQDPFEELSQQPDPFTDSPVPSKPSPNSQTSPVPTIEVGTDGTELPSQDETNASVSPPQNSEVTMKSMDHEKESVALTIQPTATVNQVETNFSEAGSDWLSWLFPLFIVTIFVVGSFVVYWRRKGESSIRVDSAKPIRGEFKKRTRTDNSSLGHGNQNNSHETNQRTVADRFELDSPASSLSDEVSELSTTKQPTNALNQTASETFSTDPVSFIRESSARDNLPENRVESTDDWADHLAQSGEGQHDLKSSTADSNSADPSIRQVGKAGVFPRWFGRESSDAASADASDSIGDTASEIDSFELPDEDLGSLFNHLRDSDVSIESSALGVKSPSATESRQVDHPKELQSSFESQIARTVGSPPKHQDQVTGFPEIQSDSAHRELKMLTDRVGILEQEKQDFSTRLITAQNELVSLQQQHQRQFEEFRVKRDQQDVVVEQQQTKLEQVELRLHQALEERNSLNDAFNNSRTENDALQFQLNNSENEQSVAASQMQTFLAEKQEWLARRLDLQTVEQALADAKNDLAELHVKLSRSKAEIADLLQQQTEWHLERQQLVAKHQMIEAHLVETCKFTEETRVQRDELEIEVVNLRESLRDSQSSLTEAFNRTEDVKNQRIEFEKELADARISLRTREDQYQELQSQYLQLQNKLKESECGLSTSLELSKIGRAQKVELENRIVSLQEEKQLLIERSTRLEELLASSTVNDSPSMRAATDTREGISRRIKARFTRLYRAYEREKLMREEAENYLMQAEEQIDRLRFKLNETRE